MNFEPTKKCQTRDCRKVRILCTDYKHSDGFYIMALIEERDGTETSQVYKADGSCGYDIARDLINIPEKRKLTGWLVVFEDGNAVHWKDKHENKYRTSVAILDLSKYNIEFEEGEGL